MSMLWIWFAMNVATASSPRDVAGPLMDEYRSHIEGLHEHTPGERGLCLTGLIQKPRLGWDDLSEEQRAEITSNLAPWKADLFEPLKGRPGPPSPASDTCWGQTKDNRYDTEHFSIQWDDGAISDGNARDFAESLEESWVIEIEELGWKRPAGSSSYLMLIEVANLGGSGAGAYTTVDRCSGSYLPYVVASTGSFSSGDWYKTMACHELHHAIQYSYGYAHEFWWWEATSTWMEDLVYPAANDWATALYMFAQTPHIGMNAFAGNSNNQDLFWHTYGMGIWGMYLDQHVGGNELMRATWEESEGEWCQYCLWMPDVIEDVGHDFDELMMGYMAHTSVMAYRDRMYITDAARADRVTSLPDEGSPQSSTMPQSLGLNIIEFDADEGASGMSLEVTFDGDNSADQWFAVLTTGENSLENQVNIELDGDHKGVGRIAFEGGAPAHLIVAPMDDRAQGYEYSWRSADQYDYTWSAKVVSSTSTPGGEGETGSGESEDDLYYVGPPPSSADDDKGGCATSPTPWSGWMGGLMALVIGLRRRSDD